MSDTMWIPSFEDLVPTAREIRDTATEIYVSWAVEHDRQPTPSGYGDHRDDTLTRAHATERAHALFDDIPDLFQAFADAPDPAWFQPGIDALDQVERRLATGPGDQISDPLNRTLFQPADVFSRVATTGGFLIKWTGRAASDFKTNYLDPLPYHTSGQFLLAAILAGAMRAEQAIWDAARNDIRWVAGEGLHALEQLGDCTQAEWSLTFTVIAAIAAFGGAAAAPFTFGGSLGLEAVAAAAQVAASAQVGDGIETPFSGDSPEEVVEEIRRGIAQLVDQVHQAEQKIATSLSHDLRTVLDNWSHFVTYRPSLADATPQNVTSDDYMGVARGR